MGNPATTHVPASKTVWSTVTVGPHFPLWLMGALIVLTLALYWPATRFAFVNYDDPQFITANVHVQRGLNWEGVKWAFGPNEGDYWHPLTWLSLMLDASLFGQKAGGFHLTNVALHAANSALLFLLLWMVTGALWRSVMVATLFALHPLRVESVAWVTERKDVLSGFFGLLALIYYARYAQCRMQNPATSGTPHPTRNTQHASRFTLHVSRFYLLSLGFFACGLMSKAMLVTWPFVMLLLDYWPLGRMQNAAPRGTLHAPRSTLLRLVNEKLPFFMLGGVLCVLTYLTERGRQGASNFDESPALLRLENAFVAYARYVGKTLWPMRLAMPYVNPGQWSWLEVGGSALLVVGAFIVVWWLRRRHPYLLVGWFWFCGTMIPVIGLTKGWGSFMADRYTYLPFIGLLLLLIWAADELTRRWRCQVIALSVAGGAAIVLCLVLTRQQISYWRDSEALFQHALAVTENNNVAHNNLGTALEKKGQLNEAIREYREAIRLQPDSVEARNNLGVALGSQGQIDEAIKQFQEAIRRRPDDAPSHDNLGGAFYQQARTPEAIRQFQEAIRLKPDYADAHYNLGVAFYQQGRAGEAIRQLQEALRLKPDYANAHYNLGVAFYQQGHTAEAISQFQEVIRLNPDHAEAHNNLGTALGLEGQTDEAIRQLQEALRLKPDYAEARKNLDIVLATKAHSAQPAGPATNR